MRARYYSPEMKRFINADVIAGAISNAITLNRFAYANGNPVSFVDPFGLSAERGENEDKKTVNYVQAVLVSNFDGKNRGLPVLGHTQLYFLGDDNKWYMTDFFPEEFGNVKIKKNSAVIHWKEDVASPFNNSKSNYVVLTGDFNDSVALAKQYAHHENNMDFGRYNFLFHNCSDYTDKLLDEADIDGMYSQILSEGTDLISIPVLREFQLSMAKFMDSIQPSDALKKFGSAISGFNTASNFAGFACAMIGDLAEETENVIGDTVDAARGFAGAIVEGAKNVAATVTNTIIDIGTSEVKKPNPVGEKLAELIKKIIQ